MRLAVTLGDPRGIGPEVMGHAVRTFLEEDTAAEAVLLGDPAGFDGMEGPRVHLEGTGAFDGTPASAGAVALLAIEQAVELVGSGSAGALVTGPIHKPALHAAGREVPGQTELLQELTGAARVGMLMHARTTRLGPEPLRVLLVTTHLPLRDVPARLTERLLEGQLRLLDDTLRASWRMDAPRIGLCGLNPHASDEGLFGDEEERVMAPVVERLRREGREVTGPWPADTIFLRAASGELDAVAAPYHDVGMAVFKTLAFGRGVNTTLGLPFPRTSPDHGTGFDLVGTGRADPGSCLEALRLAARLARSGASPPAPL